MPSSATAPGRYLLPNDDADFDALSDTMASASELANAWAGYGIIQAITLGLLVGR